MEDSPPSLWRDSTPRLSLSPRLPLQPGLRYPVGMRPSTPAFHDELEKIALNALKKYELAQKAVKRLLPGQRVGTHLGSDWRWLGKMEGKGMAPRLAVPSKRFLEAGRQAATPPLSQRWMTFRPWEPKEVGQVQVPGGAPHVVMGTEGAVRLPGRKYEKVPGRLTDYKDQMSWVEGGPKRQTVHTHPYSKAELMDLHGATLMQADDLHDLGAASRYLPEFKPTPAQGAVLGIPQYRKKALELRREQEALRGIPPAIRPSQPDARLMRSGPERGQWHGIVDPYTGEVGHYRRGGLYGGNYKRLVTTPTSPQPVSRPETSWDTDEVRLKIIRDALRRRGVHY